MVCFQFDSPCLRCKKYRGSSALKTIMTKIISMPITSPAGVTVGKFGVDWLKARDVGVTVDWLFTKVLVAWPEAGREVMGFGPLKSAVEMFIPWLDADDDELEALDSSEVSEFVTDRVVLSDIGEPYVCS